MSGEGQEIESGLVRLCIEAACKCKDSVEKWRRQRRTLELLPTHLAEALLRHLLHRRLVSPSLLEVFQYCVEEVDLKGDNSVDAEWMAYLGAFRNLRKLNIANCRGINNSSLWSITGIASLKELDLSRCLKVTDAGIVHLLSISNLEKLCVSETGLTANGVTQLSSLRKLSVLDLGGLLVTDMALRSLQVLTKLEYLDLWGSEISDTGAYVLKKFPKLSFLNLAWTKVTKVPNLPSLACLNMSYCAIHSIFEGRETEVKAPPLAKLLLHEATFIDLQEAFSYIDASGLLLFDLSNSSIHDFHFLPYMNALEHLDISVSRIGDDSIELIAQIGANLKILNLSTTRLTSTGVGILAGNVPNLENLSLSHTAIDDVALSYISLMPSLKVIDLCNTRIKGYTYCIDKKPDQVFSLTLLQNLDHLERLNLEDTQVKDVALYPLSDFKELKHLSLKSDFLSDISLYHLSNLPKLNFLGIRDSVLTNDGLRLFKIPQMLEILDMRGCWLLTEEAITSFQLLHPQIDVRHEFAHNHSFLSPGAAKALHLKSKRGKMAQSPSRFQRESFIDERLKYTREELLELQFSSHPS